MGDSVLCKDDIDTSDVELRDADTLGGQYRASDITTINSNLTALTDGDVIWTNSSPTTSFVGQPISISNEYKSIDLYFICATDQQFRKSMHIMRDGTKSARIENFADYLYRYRGVTFNNSGGLVIGDGIHQTAPGTITTNNTVCIPYKIVGFRHY